jgi:anti-sigma factor RsiW
MRSNMNHAHFQELISLHVDNEINDSESAELFGHLATCDTCRKFLRTTMSIRSHIAQEELAEVPDSLDKRVLGNEETESVKRPLDWLAPVWWTRISIPLPAAASLAFLILVGTLLVSPVLVSDQRPRQAAPQEEISKLPPEIQKQLQLYR